MNMGSIIVGVLIAVIGGTIVEKIKGLRLVTVIIILICSFVVAVIFNYTSQKAINTSANKTSQSTSDSVKQEQTTNGVADTTTSKQSQEQSSKPKETTKEIYLSGMPYSETNASKYVHIDSKQNIIGFWNMNIKENTVKSDKFLKCSKYEVTYDLKGNYQSLEGKINVKERSDNYADVRVFIYDENKNILFKTDYLKGGMDKVDVDINLKDKSKLKIEIEVNVEGYYTSTYVDLENFKLLTIN